MRADEKAPAAPTSEKILLKVKEAAEILSLSPSAVYELVAQGKIPCVKFSPQMIRIPRSLLEEWARGQAQGSLVAQEEVGA